MIDVSGIRQSVSGFIERNVDEIALAVLYGSAMDNDFLEDDSDIDLLFVFADRADYAGLAHELKAEFGSRNAALDLWVMTESYLADVLEMGIGGNMLARILLTGEWLFSREGFRPAAMEKLKSRNAAELMFPAVRHKLEALENGEYAFSEKAESLHVIAYESLWRIYAMHNNIHDTAGLPDYKELIDKCLAQEIIGSSEAFRIKKLEMYKKKDLDETRPGFGALKNDLERLESWTYGFAETAIGTE